MSPEPQWDPRKKPAATSQARHRQLIDLGSARKILAGKIASDKTVPVIPVHWASQAFFVSRDDVITLPLCSSQCLNRPQLLQGRSEERRVAKVSTARIE